MLSVGGVELSLAREMDFDNAPLSSPAAVPTPGTWLGLSLVPHRPLSPRERQILGLIRIGHTQKEVAYQLGLSDATVRVLYARAMLKLGRPKRPLAARRLTPSDQRASAPR